MKTIVFNVKGALGSFKRPQSNNNPSTFYIIPKSALIGLICGNIGIDRETMKKTNMYEILSEKLQYSVQLKNPFQIKSWSEYGYNHRNIVNPGRPLYTPAKSERLVNINYDVYLLFDENDDDINALMSNFLKHLKENVHIFPPYLGMANMHADLSYCGEYTPKYQNGVFKTKGFCTNLVMEEEQPFENIRTDSVPTKSKSFLSHDSNSYVDIYFHDDCGFIKGEGDYYRVGEKEVEFI